MSNPFPHGTELIRQMVAAFEAGRAASASLVDVFICTEEAFAVFRTKVGSAGPDPIAPAGVRQYERTLGSIPVEVCPDWGAVCLRAERLRALGLRVGVLLLKDGLLSFTADVPGPPVVNFPFISYRSSEGATRHEMRSMPSIEAPRNLLMGNPGDEPEAPRDAGVGEFDGL